MRTKSTVWLLILVGGCHDDARQREFLETRDFAARVQVMAEQGMSTEEAVKLRREAAVKLRSFRALGPASNSLAQVEQDLDQLCFFLKPYPRRWRRNTPEDTDRILRAGLYDERALWRVSEAADDLRAYPELLDPERVNQVEDYLSRNESLKFEYNQRLAARHVLADVHKSSLTLLTGLRN